MNSWRAVLKGSLRALPRGALAASAIGTLVLAVALCALLPLRPMRAPLFARPLHPEQLDEVEERLAEWSVPFSPVADNVVVDARQRNALLLRLSFTGVPHAHLESSSDMLAKVGALTPQTIVDEQKREGMAADLDLALRGIEGVQDASVIIASAKPATYADEVPREATASVRLHLRAGARLAASAVAGIRAFVAAGVPDLLAKNVTIVDDRGFALNDQPAQSDAQDLQAAVQGVLDQAFGPGMTIVRLNAGELGNGKLRGARSMVIVADARYAQQLTQIRELAAVMLGFDAARGDRIDVRSASIGSGNGRRRAIWFGVLGALTMAVPPLIVCITILVALRIGMRPAAGIVKTMIRSVTILRKQRAVTAYAPAQVRGVLQNEPPHTAAAIISALPAATAAAVLDLYPPEERSAIVRRMAREHSPFVPDIESVISHA